MVRLFLHSGMILLSVFKMKNVYTAAVNTRGSGEKKLLRCPILHLPHTPTPLLQGTSGFPRPALDHYHIRGNPGPSKTPWLRWDNRTDLLPTEERGPPGRLRATSVAQGPAASC